MNTKKEQKMMEERDPMIVTDMLANLCTELASLFRSLSKISRIWMGLEKQIGQISPTSPSLISTPINNKNKDEEKKNKV